MEAKDLEGKIALVTGSSRGIGAAIAMKLADFGAKVAVNYAQSEERANGVVAEIVKRGGEAFSVKADVREGEAVKAMVREVIGKWQKIDILVNNAGTTRDDLLLRLSEDKWDEVMNLNLRGTYLCTKAVLRYMISQQWGRIINIASIAGIMGNAGQTNYAASKGGLIAFTKSVSREIASRNITVNAVAPGFVLTELTRELPDEVKNNILSLIPLQRFGTAEEVAEVVGFLASERASYITGQTIPIDGGITY